MPPLRYIILVNKDRVIGVLSGLREPLDVALPFQSFQRSACYPHREVEVARYSFGAANPTASAGVCQLHQNVKDGVLLFSDLPASQVFQDASPTFDVPAKHHYPSSGGKRARILAIGFS